MPSLRIAAATLGLLMSAPSFAGEQGPLPLPQAVPAPSLFAGHFQLAAPDGATVDSDDLAGHPYGVFFGFTQCPDVCPTTLSNLSTALARLPKASVRVYFVSVDPERDTPSVLAQYMSNFDPRIVALTGARKAVEEAVASFGAVARRTDLPSGGYAYSHTAAIMLVNGDGLIVDRMMAEDGPDAMAARLAALQRATAPSR
ncbi:SCO family protein [Methylobacterium komagatae]|uniref:SCO family protein n=1 Tax=Methylobacterium komagatae TaxID=374425 RepID=A0ABW2BJI4_9HYPH